MITPESIRRWYSPQIPGAGTATTATTAASTSAISMAAALGGSAGPESVWLYWQPSVAGEVCFLRGGDSTVGAATAGDMPHGPGSSRWSIASGSEYVRVYSTSSGIFTWVKAP